MQESRIKSRIETRNGLSTYFWTVLYFTVLDNKINKLMLKTAHYLGFKLDRKGMLSCSDVAAARLLVSSLVSVSWFSCKYIKRQHILQNQHMTSSYRSDGFQLNNLMTCATQLYHMVYRYNKCSLSNYYTLVHPKNALENCITTVSQVCHSINHWRQ